MSRAVTRGIAFLFALAAGGTGAVAQDAPQSTSMIVALPAKTDRARIDGLKAQLGVTASRPITSLNAEEWQLPPDKVPAAFAAAGRGKPTVAVDYTGSDYRSLFVPVREMDLTPAQDAARQNVAADPKLRDVQLVRLRSGPVADRMLDHGLDTSDNLPSDKSLLINLRPGLNALIRRAAPAGGAGSRDWLGTARPIAPDDTLLGDSGLPAGDATLVVRDKAILGSVDVAGERFSIVPLGGGLHAIAKVDQAAFPAEHTPGAAPPSPAPVRDANPNADKPVPAGPLRVGVAFTPEALSALAARNTDPDQFAQLAIDKTNAGFANSGIAGRVMLAGTTRLTGTEPPVFDDIVDAVAAPGDGLYDAVHGWRRSVRANVVMAVIGADDYCGMATGIHVSAAQAYAVVNLGCAVDNLSFPHELAHLLGARHDPDTDPTGSPFAYGHGYRHLNRFRTVMAYAGGTCGGCPRVNYWAGPNVLYQQVAMGNADVSNDARVIEEMIPVYSSYFEP